MRIRGKKEKKKKFSLQDYWGENENILFILHIFFFSFFFSGMHTKGEEQEVLPQQGISNAFGKAFLRYQEQNTFSCITYLPHDILNSNEEKKKHSKF